METVIAVVLALIIGAAIGFLTAAMCKSSNVDELEEELQELEYKHAELKQWAHDALHRLQQDVKQESRDEYVKELVEKAKKWKR